MGRPSRIWMPIILLVAAALRIYGLNNLSPPGLAHDEVANWLIDRAILAGDHAIYFTAAYGHEAGYHYLQATFVALLGDHALALRLPSAFAGLLLVSVTFALARRLFDERVALTAVALLAGLFWPVFYSRLALRAITLPLVSGLSAYFWWRAWDRDHNPDARGATTSGPAGDFLLAGLFAGVSLHTYMAARAVPIFYALFTIYLALFHWPYVKRRWREMLLFWGVMVVIAAPLFLYLQTNPGSEIRISEIDAPLRTLLAGDLRPALENSVRILGMFGFAGDPLWRQNIAGLPVFDPLLAALFYLSLPLIAWRFRNSRHAFLMLCLLASTIPSIVTINAPSTIRISNILPILTIFPAIVIHNSGGLSTVITKLSTIIGPELKQLGLAILILYTIVSTARGLFAIWPQNDEVQFVWQAALTQAAAYLDASADDGPVAIAGWTPETMDPPTMVLSLRRRDLRLSHFDPTSTLVIPAAGEAETVRIIRPTILALDPLLADRLAAWGATEETIGSFVLYTLLATPLPMPQFPNEALFDGQLRFLGYDVYGDEPNSLTLITYWRVTAAISGPRRLFLHLLDDGGEVVAEDYALDRADPRFQPHWQAGDLILQRQTLNLADGANPAGSRTLSLRLGLFDPNTCPPAPCRNLLTEDGAAYAQLTVNLK